MPRYFLALIVIVACFVSALCFQESRKELAARKVAESWLPLLDSQEYGAAWEGLSPFAKKTIWKEHWQIGLTQLRTPLGALKSRTFFSTEYVKPLKGHPKQEQVLVRFMSHFENGSILESVGTIHDRDGKWRATTYMRLPPK